MKPYIPTLNDDVLNDNEKLYLPDKKLIQLLELLYCLDKRYKIEKIISFNFENYLEEIKIITNNSNIELHNHQISDEKGYFHITFEKELIKDQQITYDKFCPYAISLVIDGNIDYRKYQDLFLKNTLKR